jgi:hypothetical protein
MRASLVNRVGTEFRSNGTSELKMPGFSFHMRGNSSSFSAAVTATLMGFPVSSYRAWDDSRRHGRTDLLSLDVLRNAARLIEGSFVLPVWSPTLDELARVLGTSREARPFMPRIPMSVRTISTAL